jgi:hypothetical protein
MTYPVLQWEYHSEWLDEGRGMRQKMDLSKLLVA